MLLRVRAWCGLLWLPRSRRQRQRRERRMIDREGFVCKEEKRARGEKREKEKGEIE